MIWYSTSVHLHAQAQAPVVQTKFYDDGVALGMRAGLEAWRRREVWWDRKG